MGRGGGRKAGGKSKANSYGDERGAASGRKSAARRNTVAVNNLDLGESSDEEQQELDAFQQKRDKVSLQVSDSDGSDLDEDADQGVLDIDDIDEHEDEDEEDMDDDDLLEEAIQKGGRLGQMAQQAKIVKQKLKLKEGLGSDEEDDEAVKGKDDEGITSWGANKRAYYDDGTEEPEDEEALKEEEEEVKRLQRERAQRTSAADYGVDEDEDEEQEESEDESEESEEEDTMEAKAKKAAKGKGSAPGVAVETVTKQLDALTADERSAALMSDAPELEALLEELTAALNEVRHRVGPLVSEVRQGNIATKEGLSYLEVKHLLLLQYAMHIVFYLLLKAEGRSVRDHPVITRLLEIKAYLEKIRPIDKQLSYQINKLLRAAAATQAEAANGKAAAAPGVEADEDELGAAPRPDQLVARNAGTTTAAAGLPDRPEGAGGSTAGVYRPPKLNPVSMEDDDDKKRAAMTRTDKRMLSEARRRAARSDVLADLAAEVAGAPEELRHTLAGFDTLGALRMKQKLEARAAEEEDNFIRVPLSRDQAKALKAQKRAGFSTAALMGDFADEVADLVDTSMPDQDTMPGKKSALADVFARQRVSQRFGGQLDRPTARGGDEDLPRRADLGERRAKFDAVAAKRAAKAAEKDDDMGDGMDDYDAAPSKRSGKRPAGEEDEFYMQAKESAAQRKRERAESHRAPDLLPPMEDPDTGAYARPIGSDIQRNRGLTPHRRKDLKNPRKKHRIAYNKALVRRKGQVQDGSSMQPSGRVAYGGEATGVKSKVTKSRRL